MKLGLLLAPFVLLLAACGSSGSSSAPSGSAAGTSSGAPAATTAAAAARPKGEHSVTCKFCLGADGTSQDCGISCKVDKDEECCAKWAEKTKAICAKIPKAKCQEICEKDENPTACEIAKTMK